MGPNSTQLAAAREIINAAEEQLRQRQEDARIRALAGLIVQKATDGIARWRMQQSAEDCLAGLVMSGKVFSNHDMPSGMFTSHPVYLLPGNVYELARELDENWRERITQAVKMVKDTGLLGEYDLEVVFEGFGEQFKFSVVFSS